MRLIGRLIAKLRKPEQKPEQQQVEIMEPPIDIDVKIPSRESRMSKIQWWVYEDDKLMIEVDISDFAKLRAPLSRTGKTKVIASTGRFLYVRSADISFGLHVIYRI